MHTHPKKGHNLEIPRGDGWSQKPKLLKENMKLNWNFHRGGGFKPKKPSMAGVWIFSGTTHYFSDYKFKLWSETVPVPTTSSCMAFERDIFLLHVVLLFLLKKTVDKYINSWILWNDFLFSFTPLWS